MDRVVAQATEQDTRLPLFDPMSGSMPLGIALQNAQGEEIIPPAMRGVFTGAISGGTIGGVASGDLYGVAIGAFGTAGGWSFSTLLGSWEHFGPKTRGFLAGSALVGLVGAAAMFAMRYNRERT